MTRLDDALDRAGRPGKGVERVRTALASGGWSEIMAPLT
jgi:hypothetical protein